jgi:hypothetical protein
MWLKSGTFTGLNTDAWLFNYAVGVGTNQIPNGVRLAAGGMQVTDTVVTTPQLRVTGISTFTNGPVLIGSGTSTGTASQPLQVTGGAYVSGSLGIGVTNPLGRLSVFTTSINTPTGYNGQNFGIIVGTDNGDNLYDEGNGIVFTQQYASDGVDAGQVRVGAVVGYKGQATGSFGGGLKFKVQPTGAVPMVDAMVLTKDGNLGIGATIPSYKLDVNGSIRSTATGSGTGFLLHTNTGWTASNSLAQFWTGQTNGFAFCTNSTGDGTNEVVRITSTGNIGIGTINPQYKLHVVGSFGATTKSFIIDHPTKEGKKLQYGSLEGPELGVYVRGRTQETTIELPEYWTKLVDADSITVNLTPIGNSAMPRVHKVSDNAVYVFSKEEGEMDYYYTIFAERCDVDKLEVEF